MDYSSILSVVKPTPIGYKIFNHEYKSKDFVGIKSHWSDNVLLTKDDRLIQIIKLCGYSFETADDEDLDIKKDLRNSLFKGIGDSKAKIYTHIIRKKKVPYPKGYVNPDMPYGFTAYLDKKWIARSSEKESFINEIPKKAP